MNAWNEQADQLEKALLDNAPALALHYLRTAEPDAMTKLVGGALPITDNTRASVVAIVATRLEKSLSE